jgi:hypothetical protein
MNWKPWAATEKVSKWNGPFSYAAESHSFTNGLKRGLATKPWSTKHKPTEGQAAEDYKKEPHYWNGGFILATLFQWAVLGMIAWQLGPKAALAMFGL